MALPNRASHSHGMRLFHRVRDASGAFNEVGEARDMNPPKISRSPIDTTPHSSRFKRFLPGGVADPGQVSFMINEVADDEGQKALLSGINGDEGRIDTWLMIRPNKKRNGFFGFLADYEPQTPDDDAITANLTLQVDGQWWETYEGEEITNDYDRVAQLTAVPTIAGVAAGHIAQGVTPTEWFLNPKTGDTAAGLIAALNLTGALLVIREDASNYISMQVESAEASGDFVQITVIEAHTTTGTVADDAADLAIEFG